MLGGGGHGGWRPAGGRKGCSQHPRRGWPGLLTKGTELQTNGGVFRAHLAHAPWNLAERSADELQTHLRGAVLGSDLISAKLQGGGSPAAWPSWGGWQGWLGSDGLGVIFSISHC